MLTFAIAGYLAAIACLYYAIEADKEDRDIKKGYSTNTNSRSIYTIGSIVFAILAVLCAVVLLL